MMALPVHPDFHESDLKQTICERLSKGETLLQLQRQPGFPSRETVRLWRMTDRDFDLALTHAYQLHGAALADEAIELARTTANSDKDKAMSNRVTIDTLKWASSKFYPKMFGSVEGPRTSVNVAGDIKVLVTPEQRQAMIQARAELLGDARDAGMAESGIEPDAPL